MKEYIEIHADEIQDAAIQKRKIQREKKIYGDTND